MADAMNTGGNRITAIILFLGAPAGRQRSQGSKPPPVCGRVN